MTKLTTFDSLRRVAVRGSIIVFMFALSLAHPQTSSRMAGAPATSGAGTLSPLAASWRMTGNLHLARGGHTATLLANGKVLVVGGDNASSGALRSAELYDPVTGA